MREVRQDDKLVADLAAEFAYFLMRLLKELSENTEFVHQFESGRMDGIAAKVTQKISMFFEHHNVNPGAREQETQHHASGATAGNAATCVNHGWMFSQISVCPGGWM